MPVAVTVRAPESKVRIDVPGGVVLRLLLEFEEHLLRVLRS